VTHTLIRAHSKVLESDCLLRFYLPPLNYDTVSGGEGWVGGKMIYLFCISLPFDLSRLEGFGFDESLHV
jgi:hypothetical protein